MFNQSDLWKDTDGIWGFETGVNSTIVIVHLDLNIFLDLIFLFIFIFLDDKETYDYGYMMYHIMWCHKGLEHDRRS